MYRGIAELTLKIYQVEHWQNGAESNDTNIHHVYVYIRFVTTNSISRSWSFICPNNWRSLFWIKDDGIRCVWMRKKRKKEINFCFVHLPEVNKRNGFAHSSVPHTRHPWCFVSQMECFFLLHGIWMIYAKRTSKIRWKYIFYIFSLQSCNTARVEWQIKECFFFAPVIYSLSIIFPDNFECIFYWIICCRHKKYRMGIYQLMFQ